MLGVFPLFQIKLAEIPEEGLLVNVSDAFWFPDGEVARSGEAKAVVSLARSGSRTLVAGVIDVVLLLTCDRCLVEFKHPSKIDFQLLLAVADANGSEPQLAGLEGDSGELEVVAIAEPVVDLGDLLFQQMLLSLPQKVLCRSDCRGLCGRCGANLNVEACDCLNASGCSSFASLGLLLKNKK